MFSNRPMRMKLMMLVVFLPLLICIPRFALMNLGPISRIAGDGRLVDSNGNESFRVSPDAREYCEQVEFYRSGFRSPAASIPYCYRPIPVLLAVILPFSPLVAISLVSALFCLANSLLTDKLLEHLKTSLESRIISSLLLNVSYPTMYFGSSGLIDPVGIFFITLTIYYGLQGKQFLTLLAFTLGQFAKETCVITVAILFMIEYSSQAKTRYRTTAFALIIFLVVQGGFRVWLPSYNSAIWRPSLHDIFSNASRSSAWVSAGLGFGFVGTSVAWLLYLSRGIPRSWTEKSLLMGVAAGVSVWLFSMIAVYSDARFMWLAYPSAIPLIALLLDKTQLLRKFSNIFGNEMS